MPFSVELAVNEIAVMEREITLPLPGVVTSYDYGLNALKLSGALLPAAVHIEAGPTTVLEGSGELTRGVFSVYFQIESRLLVYEVVADEPENVGKLLMANLWIEFMQKFFSDAATRRLTSASDALDYTPNFPEPSFAKTAWPVSSSDQFKTYWTLRIAHTFRAIIDGC